MRGKAIEICWQKEVIWLWKTCSFDEKTHASSKTTFSAGVIRFAVCWGKTIRKEKSQKQCDREQGYGWRAHREQTKTNFPSSIGPSRAGVEVKDQGYLEISTQTDSTHLSTQRERDNCGGDLEERHQGGILWKQNKKEKNYRDADGVERALMCADGWQWPAMGGDGRTLTTALQLVSLSLWFSIKEKNTFP